MIRRKRRNGHAPTMQVNDDPDASPATVVAFGAFSLAFEVLAIVLYRPLFGRAVPAPSASRPLDVRPSRPGARVS